MGKGIIKEILTNDDGDHIGQYRVELQKDTRRGKMIVDALNAQITAIEEKIPVLEAEVTEMESQQDKLKSDINHLIWLADCVKHGFGGSRVYRVSEFPSSYGDPIKPERECGDRHPGGVIDAISKKKKPEELDPDYSELYEIITTFLGKDSGIMIRDLYYDPETGTIKAINHGELILREELIYGTLTPVNELDDNDIIALITGDFTGELPETIKTVDVSDRGNPTVVDTHVMPSGIEDAQTVTEPVTGKTLLISLQVGGEIRMVDITNGNILDQGPVSDGSSFGVGLNGDDEVVLMILKDGEMTYCTVNPFDLTNLNTRGSVIVPGSPAYMAAILVAYHNGEDPGATVYALNNEAEEAGLINVDTTDPDNLVYYGPEEIVPQYPRGPYEDPEEEAEFQEWYAEHAEESGLDPDPDDPEHYYDYRRAWEDGAEPDEDGHWPSKYKSPDHPNRYVFGVDTITNKPRTADIEDENYSYYMTMIEDRSEEDDVLYVLEATGGATDSAVAVDDMRKKEPRATRRVVQRWRLRIYCLDNPNDPKLCGVIESSDPETKDATVSPTAVVQTNDEIIITGQITEPVE